MITEYDVVQFLQEFRAKKAVWDIRFKPRNINDETLLSLDISYKHAESIIDLLVPIDYSEGPVAEEIDNGRPMWVFGKIVKGREIYIKISLGDVNKPVRCFSFHFSAYEIHYPLKT